MTIKIAIVGAGISGMTAAYLLSRRFDVTLYEQADRLGGHTATVDFEVQGKLYSVDTGFIVYNDWTYPNFIKLLNTLGVESQETSMGFSVSCAENDLEYAGNSLNTLFAQRRNLLSGRFLRMLKDIVRFNKQVRQDIQESSISADMTLKEYLARGRYSEVFVKYYLVPMGAAIWSASRSTINDFPVKFFVQFFHNHGLLNIFNRPQWRVIKGGSKQYITPLTKSFADSIVTGAKILSISRFVEGVQIRFEGGTTARFDQVVIATHSDQALALLEDASADEISILGDISYRDNSVVLHYDECLLPRSRRTWSSWNYRLGSDPEALPIVTYDMNILQSIESDLTFCVTLNADTEIDPGKVIGCYRYSHPQFSLASIRAQQRWSEINGTNRTWFCGAYWANGFHEDGVVSAQRVAERFGEFL